MNRTKRHSLARIPCILAAAGLVAAVVPGCGDGSSQPSGDGSTIPPVLKKSNDQMENFMKEQKAKKK